MSILKSLTAAAAVSAAALSVPVAAAETDDERFMALLEARGLYTPPGDELSAVGNAKANCIDLRNGVPVDAVRHTLQDYGKELTDAAAITFIRASVEVYCPDLLPVLDQKPVPPVAPKPAPAPKQQAPKSSYYPNCAAARAAGVAPLHRGDPGYSSKLDRDGDGIACE